MESALQGPVVHPPVLDLSLPPDELTVGRLRDALAKATSPILAIINHGTEAACRQLAASAARASDRQTAPRVPPPPQLSVPLDDTKSISQEAESVRASLLTVCNRALHALNPAIASRAEEGLDARLSCRIYPCSPDVLPQRLGAHVDSTLVTLLYSNAPGLQVLEEHGDVAHSDGDGRWTSEQVCAVGMPTMSAGQSRVPKEEEWATVVLPTQDALLLSVGSEWLTEAQDSLPVRSPVLHRVVLQPGQDGDRYSLPLLVNLKPDTTSRGSLAPA